MKGVPTNISVINTAFLEKRSCKAKLCRCFSVVFTEVFISSLWYCFMSQGEEAAVLCVIPG